MTEIGALALALEAAEFGGDPELQARDYASDLDHFLNPKHPALSAYYSAMYRRHDSHRPPIIDPAHARRQVEIARARHQSWCRSFRERVEHREQGGLRRLIDAHFGVVMSREDMLSLEHQWKQCDPKQRERSNSRRPVTDGYVNTGRTAIVDGERVPIVRKVRP